MFWQIYIFFWCIDKEDHMSCSEWINKILLTTLHTYLGKGKCCPIKRCQMFSWNYILKFGDPITLAGVFTTLPFALPAACPAGFRVVGVSVANMDFFICGI